MGTHSYVLLSRLSSLYHERDESEVDGYGTTPASRLFRLHARSELNVFGKCVCTIQHWEVERRQRTDTRRTNTRPAFVCTFCPSLEYPGAPSLPSVCIIYVLVDQTEAVVTRTAL